MTEEQQAQSDQQQDQQDQQDQSQQEAGQDVQRHSNESETPEGHTTDEESSAEKYPGAPRPGMIPNQAPEGQPPAISLTPPTPSGEGATTAGAGTETGESGGGEPASTPPATGPAGGPSGGGGESTQQ